MLLVCGTIPREDLSIITGDARFDGEKLFIEDREILCTQGTAALISAACVTAQHFKSAPPRVILAGDTGRGKNSHALYDYLAENISRINPHVLLMHYILPVMGLMKKVHAAALKCREKPVLMADASSMYAAKAAGLGSQFDVFTPDMSEIAFLADPDAIHPAYISRHLFNTDTSRTPDLIATAWQQKSAAKILIVKGSTDYIVENGKIICTVSEPDIPALEAIGGTGDTISGMTGAMIDAGLPHPEAAIAAARTNRRAGEAIGATPATKIRSIIGAIPQALNAY
ncbi:MAG: NAD(P)H-hydrate dehydratase [Smithellaceae bacterium]|nr:NAD(P)H-hydrate dehydratase [Smithellaceae bacterium]